MQVERWTEGRKVKVWTDRRSDERMDKSGDMEKPTKEKDKQMDE